MGQPSRASFVDRTRELVVGATGHRDIDIDDARLAATVAAELDRLRAYDPWRVMVVVSCLAEGADRLVARLAMERFGAQLVAPLPMPPDDYAADFTGSESRDEFDLLLGDARSWFVVDDGGSGRDVVSDRSLHYAQAGAWLVEAAEVLVALWDGQPARGPGGTADLVDWMVTGRVPDDYATAFAGRAEPAVPRRVVHIHPTSYRVAYL